MFAQLKIYFNLLFKNIHSRINIHNMIAAKSCLGQTRILKPNFGCLTLLILVVLLIFSRQQVLFTLIIRRIDIVVIDIFTMIRNSSLFKVAYQLLKAVAKLVAFHGLSMPGNNQVGLQVGQTLNRLPGRMPVGRQITGWTVNFFLLNEHFVQRILANGYKCISSKQNTIAFPEQGYLSG